MGKGLLTINPLFSDRFLATIQSETFVDRLDLTLLQFAFPIQVSWLILLPSVL